ncbi:hypothetical protein Ahy_B07g087211 [Arachis hypogaea]|uniref:Uncharacterized protein n=1 Tax=Arachis hypogaea TaxID=3818 RepID=A0A444YBV4_ARAHY|nr:hypothetical protein Ahy_B07g087211 [Arachis hypogaea]
MVSELNFIWDKEYDLIIRKIYDNCMGMRLQQMLQDIREQRDRLTSWLCQKIKKALYVHCETNEGFRNWCLTNRANRVSARSSKYTVDLDTFMKTKARLQSGDDTNDSAASVVDPNAVWCETTSALYKNCIYGLGLLFTSSLGTSMLRPSSASATSQAVDSEEGIDLRLHVQELTCSLHKQAQELTETRESPAGGSGAADETQISPPSPPPQQDYGNDDDDYQNS